MLTRSMAVDCKKEKVAYLALAPGSVKTEMGGAAAKDTVGRRITVDRER